MKPKEAKPDTIYRIIDKATGKPTGSYSRAYCDEYDFTSVEDARSANCHDMFQDKGKYRIAKYKVTYELLDDDCDGARDVKPEPTMTIKEMIVKEMFKRWGDSKNISQIITE